jgi:hypothetical protein
VAVAVLGALSAVGVGVSGLLLATPGSAPVVPPLDSFVVEHADTTSGLLFTDVTAGWSKDRADGLTDLTGLTGLTGVAGSGR